MSVGAVSSSYPATTPYPPSSVTSAVDKITALAVAENPAGQAQAVEALQQSSAASQNTVDVSV
jgi:hypothetical protein